MFLPQIFSTQIPSQISERKLHQVFLISWLPNSYTPNLSYPRNPRLRIEPEKFARGSGEQLRFFFRRKFLHRFDELARMGLAQRERIIRTERDALRSE